MESKKENLNSIDIAKLVAALFVVSIHMNPIEPGLANDLIIGIFARLAVPFFYLTSSYLFFAKGNVGISNVTHYVKRLLILYTFWFVVNIPIMYIARIDGCEHSSSVQILLILLRDFFLSNTYDGSYFIISLIECVPLVYFMSKYMKDIWLFVIGLLLFLFVSVCLDYYTYLPPSLSDFFKRCGNTDYDLACTPLTAYIYVVIGKILAYHKDYINLKKWHIFCILLLSFTLYYTESLVFPFGIPRLPLSRILASVTVFICIMNVKISSRMPYKQIRRMSTIIFFSHFIFVFFVWRYYYHITEVLKFGYISRYLLVLSLSILAFFFISFLSDRKYTKWIKYSY